MDDNADYDFVRLAEGDFPELARQVQEKRNEAGDGLSDTNAGAVTDTLIDTSTVSTDLFGVVQRAAAIAGASRQRVIENLDRRTFLKDIGKWGVGTIAGTWVVNKLGLSDFGINEGGKQYLLPSNVDYSPLWSPLSADKTWLNDQLDGSSSNPDGIAAINHLLYIVSKHGNSFVDTDYIISFYDRFLSENSHPDLVHYLTYRKAIDFRYMGFPDTSFEISKDIHLGSIRDRRLRCYIADNFHLQCTQNSNCKKPISEIISHNARQFLDFDVSDFSSQNWIYIYQNYGSRGLLQVKDFIVNLIKQQDDQDDAWFIYEEYRRFAIFCMTLSADFERDADRAPIASFLIPIWGTSAIAGKFLSEDWLGTKEIFADVYELGFAPDHQKVRLQTALDEQRSRQSSPVIIQLALLKAIFDQKMRGNGLDPLEKMLPNYAENLRKKRYCNRLAREIFYTALKLGNRISNPPSDLHDPRFEGQSPIYNLLKLHFDHG